MIRKDLKDFNTNIFKEFPSCALLTAGDINNRNTMTISWGFMGTIWNKSVVAVFVRPTRHTFKQMEESDRFTLSFMPDDFNKEVAYMGSHSGANENKYEKTGLIPVYDNDSFVSYIKGAKYVMKCKKLYADFLKPECFIDKDLLKHYNIDLKDYHKVYIAEITSLLVSE